MIRGPVVPLSREGLWRLVSQRSDLLERGLRPVAEGLELGTGRGGFVDGLLRDANGTAVLVFVAEARDATLPARVLAAHGFWQRNAAGMPRAMPEADLLDGDRCRLVVIGADLGAETVATLERLQLDELEVIEIDSFQVGGQERLVVRPLCGRIGQPSSVPIDDSVDGEGRELLGVFEGLMAALDPEIRLDGDRFSRRASIAGRRLGECWYAEKRVHGSVDGGEARVLGNSEQVRGLADQIARRYLAALGRGTAPRVSAPAEAQVQGEGNGPFGALRRSLTAARLSREECSALEGEQPEHEEDPLAEG